ncbi:MAG: DEAD/DEAH box helicase [Chloroflexi bacterium]|nr:DEAD/DEAH box helicase [Chloroflexota bacterium]
MTDQSSSAEAGTHPGGDALGLFLPWVADWFREEIGEPTPPQRQAWPSIARGEHTLIHSPTGSGKTFAAFLWALNGLFTAAIEDGEKVGPAKQGIRTLYVSPLKALNNDIERNLRAPLRGIREFALDHAVEVPDVRSAVRTGDTSQSERRQMVRKPPDILITTPESLYLILTSPVARDILRTVDTVILDEIHTVSGSKRGAHLSLSLERLERLSPGFQRIGLSATQRPLDEVARFLGGLRIEDDGSFSPRPVTVVDADYPKEFSLRVMGMPAKTGGGNDGSVWPGVIPQVLEDVQRHHTTLIFTNSRRQAERTADRLNAQLIADMDEAGYDLGDARTPIFPHSSSVFASGAEDGPFRAHHGSMSNEARREMEEELKDGLLPALIGTSSLELGIDIGSIDLVVQLQSPKSVTTGLQRVGRSGHMVGQTSRGKLYATHNEDLLESAVVARGMVRREVEEVYTPQNALDVLAQQIVATVAMEDWKADELFRLVLGSYAYRALERSSFDSVLHLIAGKYPRHLFRSLRARIHWDETNGVLAALPGSRLQALNNAGTIVDRGGFPVYLGDGKTRIGELDEEFVYETHPGDAFLLGSQVWRASEVRDDRVIVEPAPGALPRMPFWKGEFPWRPYDLSVRLAGFRAELADRILPHVHTEEDPPSIIRWLREEYFLDDAGARQALGYVRRQLRSAGAISSDRTVLVETYQDPLGDRRMVIHSPFGGRVNAPWAIALASALRERTGVDPEIQVGDDGILLRVPESDAPLPVDMVTDMDAAEVRERVLAGLVDSAVFGARFRQNAGRALLLPGRAGGRRTPFYLQRLRARDLLAVARNIPDFPILLETFRDVLEDEMNLPALERIIDRVQAGEINVTTFASQTPSPVAQALNFDFNAQYMYEWDAPKAERSLQALQLDRAALAALFRDPSFAGMLRPEAVSEVVGAASHTLAGSRARSVNELAQLLEDLGDLTTEEVAERCDGDAVAWLQELEASGRVRELEAPDGEGRSSKRWVATAKAPEYEAVFAGSGDRGVLRSALRALLARSGPLPFLEIQRRYPWTSDDIQAVLDELAENGEALSGYFSEASGGSGAIEWADEANLERIQARTLSLMRAEVIPVSPVNFQENVLRMQGLEGGRAGRRLIGNQANGSNNDSGTSASNEDLRQALESLRGLALPPADWTGLVLPARVQQFSSAALDNLFREGEFAWVMRPDPQGTARVRVIPRGSGRLYLSDDELLALKEPPAGLPDHVAQVFAFLSEEGVASSADLRSALSDLSLMDLRDALRELAFAGLATADSWMALIGLLSDLRDVPALPEARRADAGFRSLTRRTSGRRRGRGGDNTRARDAARRVREATLALPPEARWSLTTRYAVMGPDVDQGARARARSSALLERYGVVSRQAIDLEGGDWAWGPIVSALSLMELRGAARRGYFVAGLPGLQFAMPAAVEDLRRNERGASSRAQAKLRAPLVVSLRDPAYVMDRNLVDAIEDAGDTGLMPSARRPGSYIVMSGGAPVLLVEENGARIRSSPSPGTRRRIPAALKAFRDRRMASAGMRGRITVREWNGEPVLETDGRKFLVGAGFREDFPGMTYDAVAAQAAARR